MNEEKYIKGFNNGFILAEHKPELLNSITANLSSTSEYIEEWKDGGMEFKNEKPYRLLNEIEQLRLQSNRPDLGKEKE